MQKYDCKHYFKHLSQILSLNSIWIIQIKANYQFFTLFGQKYSIFSGYAVKISTAFKSVKTKWKRPFFFEVTVKILMNKASYSGFVQFLNKYKKQARKIYRWMNLKLFFRKFKLFSRCKIDETLRRNKLKNKIQLFSIKFKETRVHCLK